MDSLIRPLIPNKAAFGRHETFSLRYSWLTKGFQAFQHDNKIFTSDEATVRLGVGKNMVNSIRYWLRATQILETKPEGLQTTEIGKAIFSEHGWDPYLEDEATLWLIHWLVCSNAELATAWFWFFNCFHKSEFTVDEAANALVEFVNQNLTGKHSERTVKHEINLILRMYSQTRSMAKLDLEDVLDVPLVSLRLISLGGTTQHYISRPERRQNLPLDVIGFAVNEVFNQRKVSSLPIADLMYGEKHGIAIGSAFRLTEGELLSKLEDLIKRYPGIFNINETAGINQLFRDKDDVESLSFLRHHYESREGIYA
ncbi:DUF4007 family protein [Methylomarinum sp. Ch1-1]|uniref:DUF4007 family protein n=1 Tax=Methylomarinum roseum TaxID=3067653 RepID=A0AAU7NQF3_9GAMM